MRQLRYITLLLPFCMLAACNSECYENQNALPLATFVANDSVQVKVAITGVSVYGIGAPNDSLLWDGSNTSELYLPFRVDQDSTSYVFEHIESGIRDTVTFRYDRAPVLVSEECGVSFVYEMRSISNTHAFIDSVVCPEGRITNKNASNLIIYLAQ